MTGKKKSGFNQPGQLPSLVVIGGDIEGITRTAIEQRVELDKRTRQAQRARRGKSDLDNPDKVIAYWNACRASGCTVGKADERTASHFFVSARTIRRERKKREGLPP